MKEKKKKLTLIFRCIALECHSADLSMNVKSSRSDGGTPKLSLTTYTELLTEETTDKKSRFCPNESSI